MLKRELKKQKKRLETILIDETAANGCVKVTVTASKQVKSITISEKLSEKEEIEDYLIIALNKALSKANNISEAELAAAAKDGIPNIPGIDMFK